MADETPGRRRFRRVPFDGSLKIRVRGEVFETRVADVSLKGLLARRPAGWDVGLGDHPLSLELSLDGGTGTICMEAVAAHVSVDLVGFEWKEIGVDDLARLRRLLTLNLGGDELVDRELADLIREHS